MNTNSDLDVAHITDVCASAAARPPTVRAGGEGITLLFAGRRERDQAGHALTVTGYAMRTGELAGVHPNGLRVTGWSADALERRAAAIRAITAELGADDHLHQTADLAVEAAARRWPDVDPYATATAITSGVMDSVRGRVGPLIPSEHPPVRSDLAERLRTVERLSDRLSTVLGTHFNVACIATDAYARNRHHGLSPDAAKTGARSKARAFVADRFDIDAFVEAIAWAHPRDPHRAAPFAVRYARTYGGTDPDGRPPPADAYAAWRDPTAPHVAATDFPHPPTTTPATQPTARRDAPGSPSPGRGIGGGPR